MKATKATHPAAIRLMLGAFPEYRGRKFSIEVRDRIRVEDVWGGGSRTYVRFVELATGRTVSSVAIPQHLRQQAGNPMGLALADVPLQAGIAAVEHVIFCGKDCGLTLTFCRADAPKMLPPAARALCPHGSTVSVLEYNASALCCRPECASTGAVRP